MHSAFDSEPPSTIPLRLNSTPATCAMPQGPGFPDPFAPRPQDWYHFVTTTIFATALFRCWHILLFIGLWSTLVAYINHDIHAFSMQPTLITVLGTVLGFVVSYRTTSSFERYNEGRKLWSQIVLGSRTFSRTVWFHVPDMDENRMRVLIEKKTVINLLEAYSIAIKHYLRGEVGIYYKDLYYLTKFLPSYALPAGVPSQEDLLAAIDEEDHDAPDGGCACEDHESTSAPTTPRVERANSHKSYFGHAPKAQSKCRAAYPQPCPSLDVNDEKYLLPARNPPKYHIFDLFPFSLLVRLLTRAGKRMQGRKAARMRSIMRQSTVSHNLPLEISLYLSSYVADLQSKKLIDVPTTNALLGALNQLVDSLTGLERILTTPIPFSYSIHLWTVTMIYCLALPVQLWLSLGWLTIPATIVVSFIFFGFLVAGEEIERYDKNDLDMDHFTRVVIRHELRALTSAPAPKPSIWAFLPENNYIFTPHDLGTEKQEAEKVSPDAWMKRGSPEITAALQHMGSYTHQLIPDIPRPDRDHA
ncbi:UPF0187-domain-containing protein [Athelia psychrophila]|uniref:UPF0187-domain-containing protein n=1 Tax=Athelia psychrophila TaxID=1759441 RepID=A0A166UY49_9AGAM|nr:UPF0187-domain-containing protein [Fibularhizoctonia sp. CBS 109695]